MTEAEIVDEQPQALVPANGRPAPLVTIGDIENVEEFVERAKKQWEAYQELTRSILDASDYQKIGGREFKKKSAWRKYATAFNISTEVIKEEIVRAEDGYPIYARVVVRATAPNGRYQEADHECHVTEKCCPKPCPRSSWQNHACCGPDCDGRRHFSHPGDIPAIATTRAKNRAISDLIGAGEVSADEMSDAPVDGPYDRPAPPTRTRRQPAAPKGQQATPSQEEAKLRFDLRKALEARFGALPNDEARAWVMAYDARYTTASEIAFPQIPGDVCRTLIEKLREEEPA